MSVMQMRRSFSSDIGLSLIFYKSKCNYGLYAFMSAVCFFSGSRELQLKLLMIFYFWLAVNQKHSGLLRTPNEDVVGHLPPNQITAYWWKDDLPIFHINMHFSISNHFLQMFCLYNNSCLDKQRARHLTMFRVCVWDLQMVSDKWDKCNKTSASYLTAGKRLRCPGDGSQQLFFIKPFLVFASIKQCEVPKKETVDKGRTVALEKRRNSQVLREKKISSQIPGGIFFIIIKIKPYIRVDKLACKRGQIHNKIFFYYFKILSFILG